MSARGLYVCVASAAAAIACYAGSGSVAPPTVDGGSDSAPPLDASADVGALDANGADTIAPPIDAPIDTFVGGDAGDPTFTRVSALVLGACGSLDTNTNCHGTDPFEGNLDLRAASAYAALVDAAAYYDPTWTRVVPGNPDRSLLMLKLLNELPDNGSLGRPMPIDRGGTWTRLTDDQLALVRAWIVAGARDD